MKTRWLLVSAEKDTSRDAELCRRFYTASLSAKIGSPAVRGRLPQGGEGGGEGDTYKCALNINPFERAGATGFACALLNLRGNLRAGGPHRKCTEVRCRALKNVYSQNAKCAPIFSFFSPFFRLAEGRANLNP